MEANSNPATDNLADSASRLKRDAGTAASNLKAVAADEIKNLIADVEELVARIADLNDADVASVRNRVMATVDAAKDSLAGGADVLKRRAQQAASGADGYVRESPWIAVGLAALVGAVAGILVARRS